MKTSIEDWDAIVDTSEKKMPEMKSNKIFQALTTAFEHNQQHKLFTFSQTICKKEKELCEAALEELSSLGEENNDGTMDLLHSHYKERLSSASEKEKEIDKLAEDSRDLLEEYKRKNHDLAEITRDLMETRNQLSELQTKVEMLEKKEEELRFIEKNLSREIENNKRNVLNGLYEIVMEISSNSAMVPDPSLIPETNQVPEPEASNESPTGIAQNQSPDQEPSSQQTQEEEPQELTSNLEASLESSGISTAAQRLFPTGSSEENIEPKNSEEKPTEEDFQQKSAPEPNHPMPGQLNLSAFQKDNKEEESGEERADEPESFSEDQQLQENLDELSEELDEENDSDESQNTDDIIKEVEEGETEEVSQEAISANSPTRNKAPDIKTEFESFRKKISTLKTFEPPKSVCAKSLVKTPDGEVISEFYYSPSSYKNQRQYVFNIYFAIGSLIESYFHNEQLFLERLEMLFGDLLSRMEQGDNIHLEAALEDVCDKNRILLLMTTPQPMKFRLFTDLAADLFQRLEELGENRIRRLVGQLEAISSVE